MYGVVSASHPPIKGVKKHVPNEKKTSFEQALSEIIVSKILQARDGFKLLKSTCRLTKQSMNSLFS